MNFLLRFPARWSLPLVLFLMSVPAVWWFSVLQHQEYSRLVESEETIRIKERLAIEQMRL